MLKVKTIEKAIEDYRGNVSRVAESFGVARSTVASRIAKSDTLKKTLEDARNKRNDTIRDVLYEKAEGGETVAAIFIAKTQMGWRETAVTHHTGEIDHTIKVRLTDDR